MAAPRSLVANLKFNLPALDEVCVVVAPKVLELLGVEVSATAATLPPTVVASVVW